MAHIKCLIKIWWISYTLCFISRTWNVKIKLYKIDACNGWYFNQGYYYRSLSIWSFLENLKYNSISKNNLRLCSWKHVLGNISIETSIQMKKSNLKYGTSFILCCYCSKYVVIMSLLGLGILTSFSFDSCFILWWKSCRWSECMWVSPGSECEQGGYMNMLADLCPSSKSPKLCLPCALDQDL